MAKHIICGIMCKTKKIDVMENLKIVKTGTWWPPGQFTHWSSLSLVFYIINKDGVFSM